MRRHTTLTASTTRLWYILLDDVVFGRVCFVSKFNVRQLWLSCVSLALDLLLNCVQIFFLLPKLLYFFVVCLYHFSRRIITISKVSWRFLCRWFQTSFQVLLILFPFFNFFYFVFDKVAFRIFSKLSFAHNVLSTISSFNHNWSVVQCHRCFRVSTFRLRW